MSFLNRILRTVDKTNEEVGRYVSLLIIPLLLIMVAEVFLRYVLKSPTVWGTELTTYLFAGYTLLGAGYTHLKKAHVNMNALYGAVNPRTKAIFDLITASGFFLYCFVLLYQSTHYCWGAYSGHQTSGSDWNPIIWPILITLPLGTLLLLLQGMSSFIRDITFLVSGKREGDAE